MAYAAIHEQDLADDVADGGDSEYRKTPCGVFNASAAQAGRLESVQDEPSIDEYRRRVKERYRAEFRPLAVARCKDQRAADAAIDDAFAEAFKSLSACGNPARFREWFREILARRCDERSKPRSTRPLRVADLKKQDGRE
jgi:hypothetical protein